MLYLIQQIIKCIHYLLQNKLFKILKFHYFVVGEMNGTEDEWDSQ